MTPENNAYLTLSKASGIKVGDTVKVVRAAKSNELGWGNTWASAMDQYVGKICSVEGFDDDFGINLNGDIYSFPFFVLETVSPAPPPNPN